MIVSLIFIFSSVVSIPWVLLILSVNVTSLWQGGILGAVSNIYLTDKLGFGKVSGALREGNLSVNSNAVSSSYRQLFWDRFYN